MTPKEVAMAAKQPKIPAWLAAILIALGAIGGGVVASQPQPAPPPVTTTTTTTTAPPLLEPTSVKRFAADTASWNQLAATFGPSKTLQPYVERWWRYGGGADKPGYVSVAFGDYSIPVYDAANATTVARVYLAVWAQRLYVSPVGVTMPWNPAWKPGTGNDGLMTIIDYKTGTVWSVGGIGQLAANCWDLFGPNGQAGFDVNNPNHLCTSGMSRREGIYTFADGTTVDGRGMGIDQIALTVRASEVRSGAIRHAVPMAITATMFGPACPGGSADPGFGVSCGSWVKPATKLERINPNIGCAAQVVSDTERSKTIPEGMRFALRITDAEINTWLDARKYTGQLRETARIFAVALRDYGWIIAETGCHGMLIQTDSVLAGDAAPVWKQLGISGSGAFPNGDLLAGLITQERTYVVEPPK